MNPPPPFDGAVQAAAPQDQGAVGQAIVPVAGSLWRKFFAFSGPGYLVAVGYMDPGNWATGLTAGAEFGYRLLCIVLLANLGAMVLQSLAAKLGIATGLDLAQACRIRYGRRLGMFHWILCELAIVACDLAELIGAAVALKLLFGLPLVAGIIVTGLEVLLILHLQQRHIRGVEAFILALMVGIAACFAIELVMARPDLSAVAGGMVPDTAIVTDTAMLYLAIGVLGATIMPHNLYLHSALVQSRSYARTVPGRRQAIRFATLDLIIALSLAIFINGAIVVLAGSAFHGKGIEDVGLEEAYHLLAPALGTGLASTLFAVALLASGQNSSITGTLAGQIVMEGFTDFRWPPWMRRLAARLLAMVPAVFAIVMFGEQSVTALLILSQVVLSLQLPFAVYPLVRITNDPATMGAHVNPVALAGLAWTIMVAIVAMNALLLVQLAREMVG